MQAFSGLCMPFLSLACVAEYLFHDISFIEYWLLYNCSYSFRTVILIRCIDIYIDRYAQTRYCFVQNIRAVT